VSCGLLRDRFTVALRDIVTPTDIVTLLDNDGTAVTVSVAPCEGDGENVLVFLHDATYPDTIGPSLIHSRGLLAEAIPATNKLPLGRNNVTKFDIGTGYDSGTVPVLLKVGALASTQ
jgi:hypothetical protein